MIKGVTYILNNNAVFQALVGHNKSMTKYKAYPVITPQEEEAPYSVCKMTSKALKCKGLSEFDCGFDVVSYAKNYDDVQLIDDAVLEALVPYVGTVNGVAFSDISFQNTSDDFVETYGGLYVKVSSFTCSIKITALT